MAKTDIQTQEKEISPDTETVETSWLTNIWEVITSAGLAKPVLKTLTHIFSIILVLVMAWVLRGLYLSKQPTRGVASVQPDVQAADLPTPTPTVSLPPLAQAEDVMEPYEMGIPRLALLHTTIPTRPRVDVITYTVEVGDSVFGIADKYGLRPETILWGNYEVLADNPHILRAGQVLNILPVDGIYHRWSEGENFRKVAEFYGVDPLTIVEWPGNHLDPFDFDVDNPTLEAGVYLIVPGGSRPLRDWGPPPISRTNPAVASTYGPGFCGEIYEGAVGTGTFIWPTTSRFISGYHYDPVIHPAIDIGGDTGYPIYSTDGGVVVYSGWSNYGYGYMIVIDHGNGWQSLYAHLSAILVGCGQSVFQGTIIGSMGSTGQSTGPHLHFELRHADWGKVNPLNFLP
ncbi:MAG: LysM peptidoglycan-binding domain-containing M23 family metallopeptidase [Chloroflexota bacterium]